MDPLEYLKALRRRWAVVAACLAVALLVGFVMSRGAGGSRGPRVSSYRATVVLIDSRYDPTSFGTRTVNLATAAAIAKVGEVPARVARALGEESPQALAASIATSVDEQTGLLRIAATSRDPGRAVLLANTFARELMDYLRDQELESVSRRAELLNERLEQLTKQVNDLERRIASAEGIERELLVAQRDSAIRQYGFVYDSLQQLQAQTASTAGLSIVERATALPVPDRTFRVAQSRTSRMALAGILGLLGGMGVALALERLDPKLRTREVAERSLRAPVLAEIPRFPRADRPRIIVDTRPRSFAADAFRLLTTAIRHALDGRERGGEAGARPERGAAQRAPDGKPKSEGRGSGHRGTAILVTSAGPTEGKTTVVANLAAALAELGRQVLVLSCDFRRPVIHRYFRVPNDAGLADALVSPNGAAPLERTVRWTHLLNVRLVPSGPAPDRPGELLGSDRMREVLQDARQRADYVLLDTSPLLGAGDAAPLLSEVDGVLVVAHASRTTVQVAQRLGDLLQQLGAPVLGVALNGAEELARARRYYWYYGSLASARDHGGFPRLVRHRDED
ncbi:MAG TPA: polysaccharide biosynthesis tyrosine autokinase [Actinomycetota bacterium]|nr:polysaccharide biosynthesis tyrosine autokinase [Actinomycetota bacterium]